MLCATRLSAPAFFSAKPLTPLPPHSSTKFSAKPARNSAASRSKLRSRWNNRERIWKLLAPISQCKAAIAIGSRYAEGAKSDTKQPWWRVAWSRLANKLIQRSLVPGVKDTQCGFKAFTAEAARDLFRYGRIDGWAFDLEILALARRRGYGIAEVGVEWTDDRRSRVNPIVDMWKVIREALTIRKNLRTGVYRGLPA